jgi:single-stranded DNA-binding protein
MSSTTSTTDIDPRLVNLGVLCGPCSTAPEVRVLESGTRLATLAVRCPAGPAADERATSVPVTVWNPPAWVDTLEAGEVIVVVGRLRRRFYQRPGGVGSRVDLEAEYVGRARDRRRIDAALRRALEALDALG